MNTIKVILENLRKNLLDRFRDNMKCLILYGSWAKGIAKGGSDIDLLVVFDRMNGEIRKSLYETERDFESERSITLVPVLVEDFQKEKNPLCTAVKIEGKILWGDIDFTINPEPPEIKYAEYFEKSREVETKKVEMAESILKEYPDYRSCDLCFVASKHAIQMALAMKGIGYSSKVEVLLPLIKEHMGGAIAQKFKKLFNFYVKSEYGIEFLATEETKESVELAKEILRTCYGRRDYHGYVNHE